MTNQIIDQIKLLAENNRSKFIEMRRHLHANPELSFAEFETSKFVKNQLIKIGITDIEHVANTGIVALIKGKNSEKKRGRRVVRLSFEEGRHSPPVA